MTHICPTVTATDLKTFKSQLQMVGSLTNRVHIDVMDGTFAPTLSPALSTLAIPSTISFDLHVMYQNPQDYLNEILALRPRCVIVHAEAFVDIAYFAHMLRKDGIYTGVALLPTTSIDTISHVLPHIQQVLIFGGKLGYHGGVADLTQLDKVQTIITRYPRLEIGWDGGVTVDNIVQIAQAGVSVINVGSCIHTAPNPLKRYKELQLIVEKNV